jgi:hypothetical protein
MDDEAYVRSLLAILTNPDVHGGDVWVESLTIVEGPHGKELEVIFGLAVPPGEERVPATGTARVEFDQEWRHLSGYDDPAAYAPTVAGRVQRAAHQHVAHHRRDEGWSDRMAAYRATLPDRDTMWRLLLHALEGHGRAAEVAPGRIEVEVGDRVITVVLSPEQWEDMLAEGSLDDIDMRIDETVGNLDEDESYVVAYQGDLWPSTREMLPPVRGRALERRFAALRAAHPDAHFTWSAHTPRPGAPQ